SVQVTASPRFAVAGSILALTFLTTSLKLWFCASAGAAAQRTMAAASRRRVIGTLLVTDSFRHYRRNALQGERRDGAGLEIDDADATGVRVGDIQLTVGVAEARGFVEGRAGQPTALVAADKAAALARLRVEDLDLAVVRVGDVELSIHILHAEG